MDDNAVQGTSDTQQDTGNIHKPVVQTVTNRGGIPVEPVQAQVSPPTTMPTSVPVADNPMPPTPIPQAPPMSPVGGPKGKEHEPMPAPFPDVVKMNENEIRNEEKEVSAELETFIEKSPNSEKPKIPDEALEAGMEHSGEDKDMPPLQTGPGALPMSYEEAQFISKKNRFHWKNSVAWFARIIQYHWKKINFNNKKSKE